MKRLGILWAIALLAACTASGCGRKSEEEESAQAVVPVRVRAIESRVFADTVTAPGQWKSGNDVPVVAPFPATVVSIRPKVGDAVRAGQVMGSLVTRESESALHGAEMLVREARDAGARAEARRALAEARRSLVRVPVVAPKSGVIIRRSAEAGRQLAEGDEVLALVPYEDIVFEGHVDAHDGSRVRAGLPALIAQEAQPVRSATLRRVLPQASAGDQSTLVWLAPAPGRRPELDKFGVAKILVGSPHQASAVPDSALVEDDLTGAVRVAVVGADGRAIWQDVVLGTAGGGWHELKAPGLRPGTRVIVEGQHGLPDSTRVRIGA